ncbi:MULTISPECIES: ABC transporter substrate-binding protein [Ramlibacter]|uniref:ABC transporter substrate-binding protein n=1 Tax=Ramlibacter pinisoli TaxID=2682844 RepID=A0A6N8IMZ7_9BURK|nr:MULTISPECIES: ABC transporter substrate-binding protein [Ramlibacter]MBA2963272.1 ABC transporter substrate-binding protein [Ramlibacter sp. CGMCC 1.13660]MVQ28239.1 ABC transporter substrate-binding protein [Ramlibacter pinisoli]
MISKKVRGWAMTAALVLGLAGGAAAQGSPTKVRYEEVVRSVLYLPAYVALSQGYFKDAGLDVSMKTSQGTDKGMAALLSGSADIVLIGPEASIYVANSESPVKPKIFAGLTATDGFLLVARTKPAGAFDWKQVKGKSVMAFRPGSNPDVFLQTAMRKHGIDPKADVKIVNNIGPAARTGAWMAGQADFGIFLEPEATMMEKNGQGFVVASVGREVGPVDYTVFTATDAFLKQNPGVAQAWTQAIVRAQKHVATAAPAQLAGQIASFFPGMSEAELVAAVERYRGIGLWKVDPVVERRAIESLQDMLVASGVLDAAKRVRYEAVVVNDFASKAVR